MSLPRPLQIVSLELRVTPVATRMPFRYGVAVMTGAPHAILTVEVEIDGRVSVGQSADHLLPKWFDKDPAKDFEREIVDMKASIGHAMRRSSGMKAASVYDMWRQLYAAQMEWAKGEGQPSLLAHFGVTMVERAVIEAVARHQGVSFGKLVASNGLGIDLGAERDKLKGSAPSDWLPERPLGRIVARHTVGLSDPITASDIAAEDKAGDGLPQALDDCIRAYGLKHFKIKIQGKPEVDQERLTQLADTLFELAPKDFAFSLDGNEQYKTLGDFVEFYDRMAEDGKLKRFLEHLIFIEQPLHRSVALEESVDLRRYGQLPPMIIDESDAERDSLPLALKLGYSGTSHKNCKGICKGVVNRCLINALEKENPDGVYMMSGEDLANTGPIALLQDLAAHAALGNESVERNGHHYFCGLKVFPPEWWEPLVEAHGDLYAKSDDGWPYVKLKDGMMEMKSVNASAFGKSFVVETGMMETVLEV